jgi:hypothetical protein
MVVDVRQSRGLVAAFIELRVGRGVRWLVEFHQEQFRPVRSDGAGRYALSAKRQPGIGLNRRRGRLALPRTSTVIGQACHKLLRDISRTHKTAVVLEIKSMLVRPILVRTSRSARGFVSA